MKLTWLCLFSPRLYKVYRDGARDSMYQPQGLEMFGDKIISATTTIMNIGLYTSPFICMYIYKRGLFTPDETRTLSCVCFGIACLVFASFIMRAHGRANSTTYVQFLRALTAPRTNLSEYLDNIRKYDFDFYAWPITYSVSTKVWTSWFQKHPFTTCTNNSLPRYQRLSIQVLAYVATHTFGLRLIYPGSLTLVQNLLWSPLFQGRTQLVEDFNGKRAKVETAEGNTIDTMFVDNQARPKGIILVICCEGNSGFYEIGIMNTPIKAGYSVLGWNHPGFAGSTGLPYPTQEHNAIDAVLQYAINGLGFKPENIVMFGWSIGGYTAAWAAVRYQVKGLVLDATFDDLLPLAENQMPKSWSALVREVVRSHVDLNVADLVTQYDGPVQLIRRTEDEIICLRQGLLSTNRGNQLLIKLISHRHPDLVEDGANPMSTLQKFVCLMEPQRAAIERASIDEGERIVLGLISRYMHDFRSTHCTQLPENHFQVVMDNIMKKWN